ncbi:gastrin-releasing peptide isoform X1 [Polypterus senegalus]|uniref:gastrin-releasing peptide isoform X1 n=1 Tax=Polypterus senegalus TaxID=55291 RepID=UPI001964C74F|nr:gastrin-releasing peptide isoform X1 [Polypterus senegalus]
MGAGLLFWKYRSVLFLLYIAVVISWLHLGSAVPVQNGAPLSKMYPRGSHWAVGHLMGKKSNDFPLGYGEDEDKAVYLSKPEDVKQIESYLQWSELVKNVIRVLEGSDVREAKILKDENLLNRKKTWGSEDNVKELTDYLLQVLNIKDNNPS